MDCRKNVGRIWAAVHKFLATGEAIKVSKNYKGVVGKKAIRLIEEDLMGIDLKRRCNIRSLAQALNINKSTLHRFIKWGKIKRHTNSIKPGLTAKNKIQRLRWYLSQLQTPTIDRNPMFKDQYNVIHVDEKWSFMSKTSEKFYLAPAEGKPYR